MVRAYYIEQDNTLSIVRLLTEGNLIPYRTGENKSQYYDGMEDRYWEKITKHPEKRKKKTIREKAPVTAKITEVADKEFADIINKAR